MVEATLDTLIRQRLGAQRYGLFFACGEGSFFPDGTEDCSGCVVAADGAHYEFWTGWDDAAGVEILATWRRIDMHAGWQDSAEYREARQAAGS